MPRIDVLILRLDSVFNRVAGFIALNVYAAISRLDWTIFGMNKWFDQDLDLCSWSTCSGSVFQVIRRLQLDRSSFAH